MAYSFSIDDKYGNFRDASSGFVVDAGGTTALRNKQPFDPYQQYTLNWGYNRDPFSLVWLQPGVDLAGVQAQLQALAQQNGNRPFLIRQADRLAVLGHAGGSAWKLTDPLITQDQLQALAQQESIASRGATHVYQDVIDHTFGSSSIFPATALDPGAPSPQSIGVLNFDPTAGPSSTWAAGQEALYGVISQQQADVPALGNWTTASVCGLDVPVTGPGAQRLPLPFANGAYGACAITLTNSFGQSLALSLTPDSLRPVDAYTGATVSVWGLPIGPTFSGEPADEQQPERRRLSALPEQLDAPRPVRQREPLGRVVGRPAGPRRRVHGPRPEGHAAGVRRPAGGARTLPDPTRVTWPLNATMTTQPQSDGTVLVSWPAAIVGAGTPLQYLLYVQAGANWNPVPGCDQSSTSCRVTLQAPASLYVIAVNNSVSPP